MSEYEPEPATTRLTGIPGLGGVPKPLIAAAEREGKALLSGDAGAAAVLVGALGYFGLSAGTGNALLALVGLVPGVVTYATTLYAQAQAALRVARDAEQDVTPVEAPRAADGTPLVKVTEVPLP